MRDFDFRQLVVPVESNAAGSFTGRFMLFAGDKIESVRAVLYHDGTVPTGIANILFRVAADNNAIPFGDGTTLPTLMALDLVPNTHVGPTTYQPIASGYDPVTGDLTGQLAYSLYDHVLPCHLVTDETCRDIYFQITHNYDTLTGYVVLQIAKTQQK